MNLGKGWLAFHLAIVAVAVGQVPVRADDATRGIVVVCSNENLAVRLSVEFRMLGYDPALVDDDSAFEAPWHLEALARARGAVAAVRVAQHPSGWQAVVADLVTEKTVMRKLDAGPTDQGAIALQTVELLRASLLELTLPEQTLQVSKPPATPAHVIVSATNKVGDLPANSSRAATLDPAVLRPGYSLASVAMLSVRQAAPEILLQALYARPIHRSWDLSAGFMANAAAFPLTGDEGQSRVRSYLAGVGASHRSQMGRIQFELGARLWGGMAAFDSEAMVGYAVATTQRSTVAAMGHGAIRVPLTSHLQALFTAAVGSGIPWLRLQFDGRTAGTWGLPLAYAAVGLGYTP